MVASRPTARQGSLWNSHMSSSCKTAPTGFHLRRDARLYRHWPRVSIPCCFCIERADMGKKADQFRDILREAMA